MIKVTQSLDVSLLVESLGIQIKRVREMEKRDTGRLTTSLPVVFLDMGVCD